jgi:hypothetical protein
MRETKGFNMSMAHKITAATRRDLAASHSEAQNLNPRFDIQVVVLATIAERDVDGLVWRDACSRVLAQRRLGRHGHSTRDAFVDGQIRSPQQSATQAFARLASDGNVTVSDVHMTKHCCLGRKTSVGSR